MSTPGTKSIVDWLADLKANVSDNKIVQQARKSVVKSDGLHVKLKRKSRKTLEVWNKEFPLVMLCSAPQGGGSIRGNVLAILSLVAAYLWEHSIRYWNKFTVWTELDKAFCGIGLTFYKRQQIFIGLTSKMQKTNQERLNGQIVFSLLYT